MGMRGKRRVHHVAEAQAYARAALAAGGALTRPGTVQWDCAGRCQSPRELVIQGRPDDTLASIDRTKWSPVTEMTVRCRKCPACLRTRSQHWEHRAKLELALGFRTWFGTLTLSPDSQLKAEYAARRRAEKGGVLWERSAMPRPGEHPQDYAMRCQQDRFRRTHVEITPELTRWLKRIRKNSGAPLRFLLVAEAHKSGLPHYHCLIHEQSEEIPIRKSILQSAWILGFTNFKLVSDTGASRYVCKYLSKAAEARVRASVRYGKTTLLPEQSLGGQRPAVYTQVPRPLKQISPSILIEN